MNLWQVVAEFQGLISALVGMGTAVVLAPRIAHGFARSREYWARRLDHAQSVSDYGLVLRNLPDAPADLLSKEYPEFKIALERGIELGNQGRLLYAGQLHASLFQLLQLAAYLPEDARLTVWGASTQFLVAETRGDSKHAKLGWLAKILKQSPVVNECARASDRVRRPGDPPLAPLVEKSFGEIAAHLERTLRRWAAPRPWRWLELVRWEIMLRQEKKLLATRSLTTEASPEKSE